MQGIPSLLEQKEVGQVQDLPELEAVVVVRAHLEAGEEEVLLLALVLVRDAPQLESSRKCKSSVP